VSRSLPKRVLDRLLSPRELEPVLTLRRGLMDAEIRRAGLGELPAALDAVLRDRLWEAVDEKYASFTEFVFAPAPSGLGVTRLPAFKLLRHLLLEGAYYEPWVGLMEAAIRDRGRPKNVANGDDLAFAYPFPRTRNSRDYMLLTLKRHHPAVFAELCDSRGSIRQAALRVGIVVPPGLSELRYGVYDARAAKDFNENAKPKLMKAFFDDLGLNAQCTFLNRLEGVLGADLARRWREHHEKC
jgi:hypothetical protein